MEPITLIFLGGLVSGVIVGDAFDPIGCQRMMIMSLKSVQLKHQGLRYTTRIFKSIFLLSMSMRSV